MSLTIAAQLADDKTAGGFQSKALAALVNQAQTVLGDAGNRPAADVAYATALLRNPDAYARVAVWLIVGDPSVHAAPAPSDAVLLSAAAARWRYFVRLGGA